MKPGALAIFRPGPALFGPGTIPHAGERCRIVGPGPSAGTTLVYFATPVAVEVDTADLEPDTLWAELPPVSPLLKGPP